MSPALWCGRQVNTKPTNPLLKGISAWSQPGGYPECVLCTDSMHKNLFIYVFYQLASVGFEVVVVESVVMEVNAFQCGRWAFLQGGLWLAFCQVVGQ